MGYGGPPLPSRTTTALALACARLLLVPANGELVLSGRGRGAREPDGLPM